MDHLTPQQRSKNMAAIQAMQVCADVLDKQVFITQGSAEKLPYKDNEFDLTTAVETVYFWPNLPGCLGEVSRVLKPGGREKQVALAICPNRPRR